MRARGKFVVTCRHALDDLGNAEALARRQPPQRDHVRERLDVYLVNASTKVKAGGAVLLPRDTNDGSGCCATSARHAVRAYGRQIQSS